MRSLFATSWIAFLMCAAFVTVAAQQTAPSTETQITDVIGPAANIVPPPTGHTFPAGETYVYSVDWRLWNAGTVTLSLAQKEPAHEVSATAETSGFVSLLYPVHAQFQANFETKSFCSQNIRKHTEEGFAHARDTLITFDYNKRKSVLDETNLKTQKSKHEEHDIPGCVMDVISAIYYVGSQSLQVGSTYLFPMNDGGVTVDARVKVEGKETVKVPAGTFQAVRVTPEAASGPLNKKGKSWVWYSDDGRHIPVQVRAKMFWGTITIKLLRIEKKQGA